MAAGAKGKKKRGSTKGGSTKGDTPHPKKLRGISPTVREPAYCHPMGMTLGLWSQDDVGVFLKDLGYEAYLERFSCHMLDGRALSLITEEHMIRHLGLMLGPALKIQAQLDAIKMAEQQT